MDLDKTGKLIAKLRKEKHLTQSKLGEMLGISDRSVSKWERGISFPNVSLINDLSNILGIDPAVLLDGKTKEEYAATIEEINNHETSKPSILNKRIIIPFIALLIVITTIVYYHQKPRDEIYTIATHSSNYQINGSIAIDDDIISINIDAVYIFDKDINNLEAVNYEYVIHANNDFLFKYGNLETESDLTEPTKIKDITSSLKLHFKDELAYLKEDIIKSTLTLRITFLTTSGDVIIKELPFKLKK